MVAQVVEALRYKPEGHEFNTQWCHWNFSLTKFLCLHYGPQVNSASNRNEFQEFFLEDKRLPMLMTLPRSCADCLEIWGSWPLGTLRACTGIALSFTVIN
jgi:hypothetical protein